MIKPHTLFASSTFRLAMVYMILFASSVLVLLGFIYWSTVGFMSAQNDATIEAEITGLAEQYRERGLNGLVEIISERVKRDPDSSSVYLFASRQRTPLAGNLSAWPDTEPDADGWLNFEFSDPRANGRIVHARARPFVLQGGLHLLVGRDTRALKATQQLIIRALLWGLAITFGLALVGGIVMSRGMLRRIESINQASRAIMAGDMSRRITLQGNSDELDQLAGNLNAMLDEIERLMEGIRQVSDNIAHDLRTPLTRLRNRLEQLDSDLQDNNELLPSVSHCIADADQLLATFAALLRIARIESGQHRKGFASLDLSTLVSDAAELYQAVAEERQQVFDLKGFNSVTVDGDRDLLFQAVANLMDNAVKYTPTGGSITIALEDNGDTVDIIVNDSGPGIPEAQRDHVGQRFYRLEHSRSTPGNGLGLSLVKAVVQLHQGQLLLEDNVPGLRVIIRLPQITNDGIQAMDSDI